ncbi:MAG TPA: PDR/VanB family oxidoreductase [Devosiaceae bacterium]|jgi:vanillate O-demethylase ferredoxin subunit|nr:PDR/VanB family oxidoreductase [Devosiaceae bacterium]
MRNAMEWRTATVTLTQQIAEDVRLLEFAVDGPLPPFDPGSHSNFRVRIGGAPAVRTYSLLPAPAGHLRVVVKLHERSRGGSRFMWAFAAGDRTELTLPENRFELSWRAPYYLLLAGGIGITPIFGMARALRSRDIPMRLVYGARSRARMAFLPELQEEIGDLAVYDSSMGERIDVAAEIAALPPDGELYACGPIAMLDAVKSAWQQAGRGAGRLRYEVFGDSGPFAEESFRVAILNRDIEVEVRPDQTLLDALSEAGVEMIHDCRRGECGICAVRVIEHSSAIDHRDVFFSPEERQKESRICACVSRFVGGRALIDIGYRR